MAKTQTAHIVITANAKAAVEVMKMLKEQTDIYIKRLDALTQKKQQGVQLTKAEEKEAKELEKKIQALTTAQQKNQAEYRKTRDVMKNIAGSTTKDLKRAYAELAKMANSTTGEQTWRQEILRKKMQEVKAQIDKNTGAINSMSKAQSGFGGALKTTLKNLVAYAGVFAIFGKAKSLLGDIVNKNKELSDSMANIRKVSQWASADVVKLTENMAKIDTRNSLATLQRLGYEGAKLGIGQYGVEGLTGFVRAAEQVQTALGEDLGEEALPALAKLTEVMGLIPKFGVEQAMQKAGSAIYQLGATSTATGANIVEFSKRLMGLANVSGVSADQLLGLGAAADTMALMPEVAATAFNKLFNSIHGNTEAIAKSVGLAKEELTSLLYEGRTMDALVKVFERMQTMSMAEMEGRGVFKELGSDGARLTNVMITMANKVDMLKKSLETSNQAFSEGRAVINEYMIQQETAAAYFERASNIWEKAFINPEGVDIVKQLAQEWYNVSYEMTHSASTMASIKNTLELIADTVKLLITYLPTLVQLAIAGGLGKFLQGIYLQYRGIKLAALEAGGAAAKFNALLKTNAIALAITGATMLYMKYKDLKAAEEEVAAAEERRQRVFTDAAAEALDKYNEQKKALDKYYDALKDTNVSEEERNNIIRQFKSEFGSYLEKLGIEINTYDDLQRALHRVNKELKDKAYYETGKALEASYVGDAKQERTNALSQYMQVASTKGLSTDVMQQIVEGKAGTRQQSIVAAFGSMKNGQMLGKLYSQLSSGGMTYNSLSDDVRQFIQQQYGSGVSISKVWDSLKDVANAAGNLYDTSQEVIKRNDQVDKFIKDNTEKYSPQISVDGAILNLKRLKELNEDKLNEGLNVLRDEWKKMSETDRKSERGVQIGGAIDQYSKQIRSLRGEGYTPPPTKKEINAAESARLKKLRSDFKQSKEDVEGLIAKVDQWYNLQDATISDFAATGKITSREADEALRAMKIARNVALEKARLAVASGDDTDWKKFYQEQMAKMMVDKGDWSSELFKQMGDVQIKALHDFLSTFDGSETMAKLDASSFFDTMKKKAAESRKIVAETQAKATEELNKMLLKYEYFDQASRQFASNLIQIGALGTTAEQMAQGMEGAPSAAQTQEAVRQLLAQVVRQGSSVYAVNPADTQGVVKMLRQLTTTGPMHMDEQTGNIVGEQAQWFDLFPAMKDWMENPEEHKRELEDVFNVMLQAEQGYYEKRKRSFQNAKTKQETRFRAAGFTDQEAQTDKALESQGQMQDAGIGATFAQQIGLGSIADDPEVQRIQNRIYWRGEEVKAAEASLAALKAQQEQELQNMRDLQQAELEALQSTNATEEQLDLLRLQHKQQIADAEAKMNIERMGAEDLLKDRQTALFDQETALATKVAQELRQRVQTINNLTKPIQDGAKNIGQKFGEMIRGVEEDSMTWNEIWRSMAQAVGDSIIDMMAQYAQNLIMEKMMNQQHKQEAISKANVDVAAGLASGGAKTVGQLGWWGLALIPVIAAVLHGLLAAAFASNKESSSSSSSTPKVKLASGMLTYDEGNADRVVSSKRRKLYDDGSVQVYDRPDAQSSPSGDRRGAYLGTDGHVYRATPQPALPDGVQLIRKPIATTVNGQPSLVAERGPEIIIGRRATSHIQMNEPGLLHHLAAINGRYRTYDQGTVPAAVPLASPSGATATTPDGSPSGDNPRVAAALEQNTQMMLAMQQTIAALSQTVTTLQQRGIPAHIQKYGTGGLIDEVKSGLKFDQRYNR